MCYDHRRWPESTNHVQRAQAGIPDSMGRVHTERFVSIYSKGALAGQPAIRRAQSLMGYPSPPTLIQRDEYPPAAFVENGGRAHIQYINSVDNSGSGGFLGRLLTPYNNVDQIELIDALTDEPTLPNPASEGSLFCRDAFP